MYFVKTDKGILEQENFFSTCSFNDLLGNGEFNRIDGNFKLSFGNVKRHFNYNEFMLDVKFKIEHDNEDDISSIFVESTDGKKYGINVDGLTNEITCRILKFDGFIQTYISDDQITWNNIGGTENKSDIILQGFETKGTVIVTEYVLYANPFLTVNNISPNFTVRLLKEDDTLICERKTDPNYKVMLPIYSNIFGKIIVLDELDDVVFESAITAFAPGDIFLLIADNIKLIYKGRFLEHVEETTKINSLFEKIAVKNCSNSVSNNINLYLNALNSEDDIEMSLDNETYSKHLIIDSLEVDEEKEIYIKVTIKSNNEKFLTGYFNIEIL